MCRILYYSMFWSKYHTSSKEHRNSRASSSINPLFVVEVYGWATNLLFICIILSLMTSANSQLNGTHACNTTCTDCWRAPSVVKKTLGIHGDFICFDSRTCFGDSSNKVLPVQQRPLAVQHGDSVEFSLAPHLGNITWFLSKTSVNGFGNCSFTLSSPSYSSVVSKPILVPTSSLTPGINSFISHTGTERSSVQCLLGLRIQVSVSTQNCNFNNRTGIACSGRGFCRKAKNITQYNCECCTGYNQEYCSEFDGCLSQPCRNGGNCSDVPAGFGSNFTCNCSPYYTGQRCAISINYCASNPCLNNATCINLPLQNRYQCNCSIGFNGTNCDTNIDDCLGHNCSIHSKCIDGINSYRCICNEGWNGTYCTNDINECDRGVCYHNVNCTNTPGNFSCHCPATLTGRFCETDLIDECTSQPCLNNGTCQNLVGKYQCHCRTGFSGANCEVDINECQSNPCFPFGSKGCEDLPGSYRCVCEPGYTGRTCNQDIDDCLSQPCANGGLCVNSINKYTCACQAGYFGTNCQEVANKCSYLPCKNNGTCQRTGDYQRNYTCLCAPGWMGKNCTLEIDECLSTPCLNNGTCQDGINMFTCVCPVGWKGQICETNIDMCEQNPCQNGGNCTDLRTGLDYFCSCAPGYSGKNCSHNINECDTLSINCNNGKCIDLVDAYYCNCSNGWFGRHCDTDKDLCRLSPCLNQGRCENVNNTRGYVCHCPPGINGVNCSTNVNECISNPCRNNGTCNDFLNFFNCSCLQGFTGKLCETEVNECLSSPCQNNGTCRDLIGAFSCQCIPGYTGVNCNVNINECISSPCLNNGTCVDRINSFACNCTGGYHGTTCEHSVCSTYPCKNGSTCLQRVDGYTCNCVPGLTGIHCDADINECDSSPCINNGSCLNLLNSYRCDCVYPFTGNQCQTHICSTGVCLNGGNCSQLSTGYSCSCPSNYNGSRCEISVGPCSSNPCAYNSTCIEKVGKFDCNCSFGFTGYRCLSAICPCGRNGRCIIGSNAKTYCLCNVGYSGHYCEHFIGDCTIVSNPSLRCSDNRQCIATNYGHVCQCPNHLIGKQCSLFAECSRQPCVHGSCSGTPGNIRCTCTAGFTGQFCQFDLNECLSNPCINGGTCRETINGGFHCFCQSGFYGSLCQNGSYSSTSQITLMLVSPTSNETQSADASYFVSSVIYLSSHQIPWSSVSSLLQTGASSKSHFGISSLFETSLLTDASPSMTIVTSEMIKMTQATEYQGIIYSVSTSYSQVLPSTYTLGLPLTTTEIKLPIPSSLAVNSGVVSTVDSLSLARTKMSSQVVALSVSSTDQEFSSLSFLSTVTLPMSRKNLSTKHSTSYTKSIISFNTSTLSLARAMISSQEITLSIPVTNQGFSLSISSKPLQMTEEKLQTTYLSTFMASMILTSIFTSSAGTMIISQEVTPLMSSTEKTILASMYIGSLTTPNFGSLEITPSLVTSGKIISSLPVTTVHMITTKASLVTLNRTELLLSGRSTNIFSSSLLNLAGFSRTSFAFLASKLAVSDNSVTTGLLTQSIESPMKPDSTTEQLTQVLLQTQILSAKSTSFLSSGLSEVHSQLMSNVHVHETSPESPLFTFLSPSKLTFITTSPTKSTLPTETLSSSLIFSLTTLPQLNNTMGPNTTIMKTEISSPGSLSTRSYFRAGSIIPDVSLSEQHMDSSISRSYNTDFKEGMSKEHGSELGLTTYPSNSEPSFDYIGNTVTSQLPLFTMEKTSVIAQSTAHFTEQVFSYALSMQSVIQPSYSLAIMNRTILSIRYSTDITPRLSKLEFMTHSDFLKSVFGTSKAMSSRGVKTNSSVAESKSTFGFSSSARMAPVSAVSPGTRGMPVSILSNPTSSLKHSVPADSSPYTLELSYFNTTSLPSQSTFTFDFSSKDITSFLQPTSSIHNLLTVFSMVPNSYISSVMSTSLYAMPAMTSSVMLGVCQSSPCNNGGICTETQSRYICTCKLGFTGQRCETYACPCENGGRCLQQQNNEYICICKVGYNGTICENFIGDCNSYNCSGRGTCTERSLDGFVCVCDPSYFGLRCEKNTSNCFPNPCNNGGICFLESNITNAFKCLCPPGYQGQFCQFDFNECGSYPCLNNGTCREDSLNSFTCVCKEGTSGQQCQSRILLPFTSSSIQTLPVTQQVDTSSSVAQILLFSTSVSETLFKGSVANANMSITDHAYSFMQSSVVTHSTLLTSAHKTTSSMVVTSSLPLLNIQASSIPTTGILHTDKVLQTFITSNPFSKRYTVIVTSSTLYQTTKMSSSLYSSIPATLTRYMPVISITLNNMSISSMFTSTSLALRMSTRELLSDIMTTSVHIVNYSDITVIAHTFPTAFANIITTSSYKVISSQVQLERTVNNYYSSVLVSNSFVSSVFLTPVPTATPAPPGSLTCQSSPCNGHKCINETSFGLNYKCVCPYPTLGARCISGISIHFPLFAGNSYVRYDNVKFEDVINTIVLTFRTRSPQGLLLYAGHTSYQDFVQLTIANGNVDFKFNTGDRTVSIRDPRNINSGNLITVVAKYDSRSKTGTLTINGTAPISRQISSSLTSIQVNTPWYVGGIPSTFRPVTSGSPSTFFNFSGCIKDFQINNKPLRMLDAKDWLSIRECDIGACVRGACRNNASCVQNEANSQEYRCQCATGYFGKDCTQRVDHCKGDPCNGGTCAWNPTGHSCLCQYGRGGISCNTPINVTMPTFGMVGNYSSFLAYSWRETLRNSAERLEISLQFKLNPSTPKAAQNGLLAFAGQSTIGAKSDDFFALGIVNNYTTLVYNLGGGIAVLRTRFPIYTNRTWHRLVAGRYGREGYLHLDDQPVVKGFSSGVLVGLDVYTPLYIGGVPDFSKLPSYARSYFTSGFIGSIYDLSLRTNQHVFIPLTFTPSTTVPSTAQRISVEQGRNVGDEAFNECRDEPCANNGTCVRVGSSFQCRCSQGWKGLLCRNRLLPCIEYNPCSSLSSCVSQGTEVKCDCHLGRTGEFCSQAITIDQPLFFDNSFIGLKPVNVKTNTEIFIRFKSSLASGLLFYITEDIEATSGDFFVISLLNRQVQVRFNLGGSTGVMKSRNLISLDKWHSLTVIRRLKEAVMQLDSNSMYGTLTSGAYSQLSVQSLFYLGGVPRLSSLNPRAKIDLESQRDFKGCIASLTINGNTYNLGSLSGSVGRNIGNCGGKCTDNACSNGATCVPSSSAVGLNYTCTCPVGWEGTLCDTRVAGNRTSAKFSGKSYVYYQDSNRRPLTGNDIELAFNTTKDGLILWLGQLRAGNQDYLALGVKNGFLRLSFSLDGSSTQVSTTVKVDDGRTYTARAHRLGKTATLVCNGIYLAGVTTTSTELNTYGIAYIGGVDGDVNVLTSGQYRSGLNGCISNLRLSHGANYFNFNQPSLRGLNVATCD